MKRIKQYIRFCTLTILLGGSPLLLSCERSDADAGQPAPIPEELPLAIGQLDLPDKLATRGVVNTGKSIGFYRTNENGYTAFNNKEGYYSNDNKWVPKNGTINLGQNTANLAVYYPYDANAGATIPLSAACCDKDESKFLCSKQFSATNQSIYNGKTISLTLDHVYARLLIKLARGTDYNANANPEWTTLKVQNSGMKSSGTYNPLLNTYPSVSGNDYIEVTGTEMDNKVLGSAPEPTTDLRIIPFKLSGVDPKLKITITVGGKEMSVETPVAGNEMKRGTQYNLTITVDATKLEITSIETVGWTSSKVDGNYETN